SLRLPDRAERVALPGGGGDGGSRACAAPVRRRPPMGVGRAALDVAIRTADANLMRHVVRDRLAPLLVLFGLGGALPGALLYFFGHRMVMFSTSVHFVGVGVSALAAAAAALGLTIVGARRGDGRTVLIGTAFTVMAALLAIHGLATPGVIVGTNGVIALTGAATLPAGGAIFALSALPALRRPRDLRALLLFQASAVLSVVGLGVVGMAFPSLVPPVPAPASTTAIVALAVGAALFAVLVLRTLKTYLLTRRAADLAV